MLLRLVPHPPPSLPLEGGGVEKALPLKGKESREARDDFLRLSPPRRRIGLEENERKNDKPGKEMFCLTAECACECRTRGGGGVDI